MSGPTQTESVYVQPFVLSLDFRAFMSRHLCVHRTFVRSCSDFQAFTRLSFVHGQTILRAADFRAVNGFLGVHVHTFVRSPDFFLP